CIYIHDTSNVTLDCKNHSITFDSQNQAFGPLIRVENVSHFSITGCHNQFINNLLQSGATHVRIYRSNNGIIKDNVFTNGAISVEDTDSISTTNNSLISGTYF